MRHLRQPARCRRLLRRRGRPKGTRLPGEHGISRPTIAQGRPSDWLHLYAAVRFPCATFSRSGPRVPAGTRPSLRPLGFEGGMTRQSSGETRREDAKACLQVEPELEDGDAALCSVIASVAKRSSVLPRRDSGLLRCARNDALRECAPHSAPESASQCLQQLLGSLDIRCFRALGEAFIRQLKPPLRFLAPAAFGKETGEIDRGPQLPGLGTFATTQCQ
jgi:hypothetical protein